MSAAATTGALRKPFAGFLRHNFYFAMAILIAALVFYGFSQTVVGSIIHPPYPRPWILFVHAPLFSAWVLLFIVQTGLIRNRNLKLHRSVGLVGIALGILMPVVGLVVSLTMDRLHLQHGETKDPQFLIVQLNDLIGFTILFLLGVTLRKKPEYHRRLMLLATCYLTDAGFARFPQWGSLPFATVIPLSYLCVDALVLCAIARDWIVDRNIGVVYRYALPAMVVMQTISAALYASAPSWWVGISRALIGA